ncbi:hypothetical protein CDIK_3907 [Cucumispora dikerogammari]|nr:hypothetical protein CDIK_3907 [Cucumispora dikerogammari]
MTKTQKIQSQKLKEYIGEFGDFISILPDNKLFCQLCHVLVNGEKKYYITAHIKTMKHQNKTNSNLINPKQTFLNEKDEPFTEIIKRLIFLQTYLYINLGILPLKHYLISSTILYPKRLLVDRPQTGCS